MKIRIVLLILLIPGVSANTADIPALNGSGTERFIAGSWTSTGQNSNGIIYTPLFGIDQISTVENNRLVSAPFSFNAHNLTLLVHQAGCGIAVTASWAVTLRVNNADTALQVSCANTSTVGTVTRDNDIVSISAGDKLALKIELIGTALPQQLRMGITLEGFKTMYITTIPVPDMTNEMLETVVAVLPLMLFVASIIWAEISKNLVIYILASCAGLFAAAYLFADFGIVTLLIVAAVIAVVMRGYVVYEGVEET